MPHSGLIEASPRLRALLRFLGDNYPQMAIAFSGGLDSRFLAHAASLAGCQVELLHVAGPHVPRGDSKFAQEWAASRHLPFTRLYVDALALPAVAQNERSRCYGCKKAMLAALRQELARRPDGAWLLCDGAQLDDQDKFRPGSLAAREAGVISPLALAGLRKVDLRALGRASGLDFWEQAARPCLLTRLAYGLAPTASLLAAIEACEDELAAIAGDGVEFRLRLRPRPLLQWSASLREGEDLAREIMAKYGFLNAEIEENAQVSGYYDRQAK